MGWVVTIVNFNVTPGAFVDNFIIKSCLIWSAPVEPYPFTSIRGELTVALLLAFCHGACSVLATVVEFYFLVVSLLNYVLSISCISSVGYYIFIPIETCSFWFLCWPSLSLAPLSYLPSPAQTVHVMARNGTTQASSKLQHKAEVNIPHLISIISWKSMYRIFT